MIEFVKKEAKQLAVAAVVLFVVAAIQNHYAPGYGIIALAAAYAAYKLAEKYVK